VVCLSLTEGYVGSLHENRHGSSVQIRRRKASGDPYWAYSGDDGSSGGPVSTHTCSFEKLLCKINVTVSASDCGKPEVGAYPNQETPFQVFRQKMSCLIIPSVNFCD
uniref:Uncharacterized protein n=1 Tax=Serinus canaria TaxID=9135 RepID=A0A8C9UB13_SERCA